jgi:hypothetical protein
MIRAVVKQEMLWTTPQETIAQARHERRVFGHDITPECGCIPHQIDALVAWNQPCKLWTGGGHRLRRRMLNRRRRNRR